MNRNAVKFRNLRDNNAEPTSTPDGQFVVFTSQDNLDEDSEDEEDQLLASLDVFLLNVGDGTLERVSVDAADNLAPRLLSPNALDPTKRCDPEAVERCPRLADSASPAISADGRLVAFVSDGVFLRRDRNREPDVYLKDTQTRRLSLVSALGPRTAAFGGVPLKEAASAEADGPSLAISANGRFVAFATTAALDLDHDHNRVTDLYVRDLRPNRRGGKRFLLASINFQQEAGGVADGAVPAISMSADGRFVAFTTPAALDQRDENDQEDVYVWDRSNPLATPILVSLGAPPPRGFVRPCPLDESCSTEYPFFNRPLSSNPALSADGHFVVFEGSAALIPQGPAADRNNVSDIYRYDLRKRQGPGDPAARGVITRVSLDQGNRETAVDGSFNPTISATGRFVAFSSAAGDLVVGDTSFGSSFRSGFTEAPDFAEDIFVKDLRTGAITRASVTDDGVEADGTSFSPSLSADGSSIAFLTDAPNILEPPPENLDLGDSLVVTEVDFQELPVDDIPGAPPGAVSIEGNLCTDGFECDGRVGEPIASIPLNFALRNTIDRPGDQDWFRVSLFADKTYVIDLESRPTRQGMLDDPLLRIFVPKIPGVDLDLARQDDDGGVGLNARLEFRPPVTGTYFISAESFGGATGTYRLLVREQ